MTPVVLRVVMEVSCVTRIIDDIHFAWPAQYLVKLEGVTLVAPRIVNDVSYVSRINHECYFVLQ